MTETFALAKREIDQRGIPAVKAAYREHGGKYMLLWPEGATVFKVS